jgi:hypothetical protein
MMAVLLLVVVWESYNHHKNLAETERRGTVIVNALEKYYAEHGHYPRFLNELSPQHLEDVPLPTWGMKTWIYSPTRTDFNLQVNETKYTGDGVSHWFRYLGPQHGWQTGD